MEAVSPEVFSKPDATLGKIQIRIRDGPVMACALVSGLCISVDGLSKGKKSEKD